MCGDHGHRGMVQVYTGEGKGKTTAALGQAIRAAGWGFRVEFYQFLKPDNSTGEHFSIIKMNDLITIHPIGRSNWIKPGRRPDPADRKLAQEGLDLAASAMLRRKADMIVLDEVDLVTYFKMVKLQDLLDLIDLRPPEVELILTGRRAAPEVLDRADLITDMSLIRHPYDRGIRARPGIEF